MFEDTQPQPGATPTRGPQPGAPIPPMGTPGRPAPVVSTLISPERTPPLPPLPTQQYPSQPRGGRGKKILLIVAGIIVLVGLGVAAAAWLFPPSTQVTNTTNTTNALSGLTNSANGNAANTARTNGTVVNTNAAVNATTNASPAVNATNGSANTNVRANTSSTNIANANRGSANATTTGNSNVNASTTNTVTGAPASYALDTDGDKLNDYLEGWLQTNKDNADSDGDSFPDGTEVTKTFSPLGTGKLTASGLQQHCAASKLVVQYKFSSTDLTTFCKIGGDALANIQVMATNAQFYEDLDAQMARSCKSFAKLDEATCASILKFLLTDYELSGSAT